MRSVSAWIVGLSLAIVVAGATVLPLTVPLFTRTLAARFSLAEEAGLSPQRMLQVAEQVRAFVVDSRGDTLPATVDGRAGFDAAAVSHLVDVRKVIGDARLVTGLIALVVIAWIAVQLGRGGASRVAGALRAGAVLTVVLVAVAAVAAFSDFESFFTAFHQLFFRSGTWTFPYDSLLIETFPEPFWASCGAAWAGLMVLGAGVLAGLGMGLERSAGKATLKDAN